MFSPKTGQAISFGPKPFYFYFGDSPAPHGLSTISDSNNTS